MSIRRRIPPFTSSRRPFMHALGHSQWPEPPSLEARRRKHSCPTGIEEPSPPRDPATGPTKDPAPSVWCSSPFSNCFRTASEVVPNCFRSGSSLLPQWFLTAFAVVRHCFRSGSSLLPHYFRTAVLSVDNPPCCYRAPHQAQILLRRAGCGGRAPGGRRGTSAISPHRRPTCGVAVPDAHPRCRRVGACAALRLRVGARSLVLAFLSLLLSGIFMKFTTTRHVATVFVGDGDTPASRFLLPGFPWDLTRIKPHVARSC